MSRFNSTTVNSNVTENLAGGKAYKISPELDLYTQVCCSTLSNAFYKTATQQLQDIQALIKKCSPLFVARLAVYARTKMNLRTIPLVLAVELAKVHNGDDLVSRTIQGVVCRADEICELLACYSVLNGRTNFKKLNKLSRQVCKGLENAFGKFNEYQLAKWNRDKKDVTFKDAICLVHPKPKNEEQSILFKKVLDDKLETPYTWEVELSRAGQEGKAKKVVWEELIDSGKMGYMAILKNLRNFVQNDVSKEHIIKVGDLLSNPEQVRKSKQFPFRFLSAYRALCETNVMQLTRYGEGKKTTSPLQSYLISSLEDALKVSVENLELFKKTDSILIASDVSGSMMTHQSEKSTITMMDIGLLLSMILNHKCSFVTSGMFGDIFKIYNLSTSQILSNVDEMYKREGEVGYATNGYKVLEYALKDKHSYDKICMFTDGQMYGHSNMQGLWNEYKKKNPNAKMYLFNLAGYGGSMPLQIEKNDVYLISGWSSEIFNVLHNLEKGRKVLDEINQISL